MKRLTWILVIASLAVNATLLAALGWRRPTSDDANRHKRAVTSTASQPATANRSHTATAAAGTDARTAAERDAATPARSLWERLHSRDPATFAANIRAAGFSVGATRGAIYALLRDLQTPERIKAGESLPAAPYWQHATNPAGSTDYAKEINRLWHERDRIMRSLFPEEQLAFILRNQARFGPLSADKLEKLAMLDRDYGEMRMQLSQSQSGGVRMPWHAEQANFLEQEKRKDIAALLTPREIEEYELRTSPTAMSLQRQLAAFNPTEQEYREIFRLRAAAADGAQLQRQLGDQIRGVLGEARYAEYQRATDVGVVAAHSIAQRLSLPANTAEAVYRLQTDMRDRASAIHANAGENAAQRDAQLAALAEEARQRMTTLLTPTGVDQYRLETGGRSLPLLERTGAPRR